MLAVILTMALSVPTAVSVPVYSPTPTRREQAEDLARITFIRDSYAVYHKTRGEQRELSLRKAGEYFAACRRTCREQGLDIDQWLSLLAAESHFVNLPPKPKDGVGITQFYPLTARRFLKYSPYWKGGDVAVFLLDHPSENIRLASLYFGECLKRGKSYDSAIKMYNGGFNCDLRGDRAKAHLARVNNKRALLEQRLKLARAVSSL